LLVKNVNGPLIEVPSTEEEADVEDKKDAARGSLRTQSSDVIY